MTILNQFKMQHAIPYYECDASGHLTVAMLFRLLILASEQHSDALKVGPAAVKAYGGGWVIINYAGELAALPREGTTITIGTKIAAYNRFFVVRDFWVRAATGEELVRLQGLFAFMDLTKRKMVTIPSALIAPYQLTESRRLPKVPRPLTLEQPDPAWQGQAYRVRFFDIDLNNHVNNAVYFDWLLDPLGSEFLLHHRLVHVKMKYDHEVRAGEQVTSRFVTTPASDRVVTHHQICNSAGLAAEAEFEWVPA